MSQQSSGSQGKFKKGTTFMDVSDWKITKKATLAEITNANTSGWEKRKLVKRGGVLTAKFFVDTTSASTTPEGLGMDQGDEFTAVSLQLGDAALEYANVPFIVETCDIVGCSQQGVVECDLTAYSNGAIPDPTAIA